MKLIWGIFLLVNGLALGHEDTIKKICFDKIMKWPFNVPGGQVSETKDPDFVCMYHVHLEKNYFLKVAQKYCIEECRNREEDNED